VHVLLPARIRIMSRVDWGQEDEKRWRELHLKKLISTHPHSIIVLASTYGLTMRVIPCHACGGEHTSSDTPHDSPSLRVQGKLALFPPPRSKICLIAVWLLAATEVEPRKDELRRKLSKSCA
jgi:hypothetical protein